MMAAAQPLPTYVESRDGVYRLIGSRVSLDSIVHGFLRGQTAEAIAQSFPTLSLEQVYGAITFYLGHREEIDEYLREGEEAFDALRQRSRESDPAFYQKLADAKKAMLDQR